MLKCSRNHITSLNIPNTLDSVATSVTEVTGTSNPNKISLVLFHGSDLIKGLNRPNSNWIARQ